MYIVSARKYRPDSFDSLIGQDNIAQTLKNSITREQLAHAYLFCGPRGVGKTSAARIFAKTINCSNPTPDMEPCGECESCRSFQEGRSYCIHELDAASNSGVDDIKALIEQVNIPPQVGRYSVFIVDEVHMLSSSAFNAFLKTLEEPPAHAIFILATTEKHKIIPTIMSRCQTYDFNRIGIADIVKNLRDIADKEGITVDDESLHVIAMKADGAMRDALTIFDQTVAFCGTDIKYEEVLTNLNVLSYEHSFSLVNYFLEGDYQSVILKFDEVLSKGFNALHFVSALSSHLRDLIVAKSQALEALLEVPASLKQRYVEQASRCSLQFLYEALSVSTACEAGYKASINPRLHVEFSLMKLSFINGNAAVSAKATPVVAKSQPAPTSSGNVQAQTVAESAVKQEVKEDVKPVVEAKPVAETKPAFSAEDSSQKIEPTKIEIAATSAETAGRAVRRRSSPKVQLTSDTTRRDVSLVPSMENDMSSSEMSTAIPDDETISVAWKNLAEKYVDRVRLYETLSSAKLEIQKGDDYKLVTFRVTNESQKKWIESRLLRDIEQGLCSMAKSKKLRVAVDVKPQEQMQKRAYMPEEQASDLMQSNPEVRNLVKDFDLNI